ncbi:RHS repeat-associated core domain-containing protein [uncultured Stenotrophomonas sp.]|uniref:RHS repeat-associated core domain-containing protein n=1 Tax=uncultured Stenotrophomonas sp. TaxID=165438 RepID=UPI0028D75B07|nr:RHS repeat-associated core domain-containing protein [uncultured Stenotrophomonas sp.]
MFISYPRCARRRALAVAIALATAPFANAQEVEKTWSTRLGEQLWATERQAQRAIEDHVASSFQTDQPFEWYIADNKVSSQAVTYYYRVKPMHLLTTAWKFQFVNTDYDSHDALLDAIKQRYASPANCPDTQITPGEWRVSSTGPDGSPKRMSAKYKVVQGFIANGRCSAYTSTTNIHQIREVRCPNPRLLEWRPDTQACEIRPDYESYADTLMTYTTIPLTSQCPIGNPCEPTTGNKSQSELDLDLGWVRFVRHFNSMTSVARGGFGSNWTHSHNVSLSRHADSDDAAELGLIEEDGTHLAFRRESGAYEAINGSGDRLSPQGDGWQLHRSAEVLAFGADGRIRQRNREDGTALVYQYDALDRLLSITHSSGRQLLLHYDAPERGDLITSLSVAGQVVASYAYGATAQVATVTHADGSTRTYHYEDTRFPEYLTGITGEDNRRFGWYGYDEKGRVTCSRHSGDCSQAGVGVDGTRLVYTGDGTTVVTDALGRVTTYGLSGVAIEGHPRKVTALTDSQGTASRSYYPAAQDFRRRLNTVIDRRGTQTRYDYSTGTDPLGGQPVRVQATTEAVGLPEQRVIETHTEASTNRVVFSRVGNRETRITRNARLQPVTIAVRDIVTNDVRTTALSYCEDADVAAGGTCPVPGLLKQVDGPRTDVSDIVTYAYHAADDAGCVPDGPGTCRFRKGDLLSVTNAAGNTAQTLAYDTHGRPLSVVDSNGVITEFTYHPRGWPTSVTVQGDGAATHRTTRISYWPTGQVQEVVEPDGGAVTYVYDAAQRLTDIADNAGNTRHYTLDDAGHRLREDTVDDAGALRRTLSRIYNTLGELTTLKDAGNHATVFTYDPEGNPASLTDALQRVTTQQHDPLNRLTRTLQDAGGIGAEIASAYNALDQVTQVTDPKGLHTTYAYNGFGDLTRQVSPDSGATDFTVDAAGNRKTRTDARGITATYHYDALNRLTGIAYPDPNLDVGYSYDVAPAACDDGERFAKGRLGQVQHAAGSTAYCHDRLGQVTRKVQTVNGVSSTVRYAYTAGGRLSQLTYPDGSVVDYVRDKLGRISQIGLTRRDQPRQVVVTDVTYAPFGPATGWIYGNGRKLERPVDNDYRVQAVHDAAAGGLSLSYRYDAVGNIIELNNGTGEEVLARYGYDRLGRLTQTQDGATGTPIETYTYDATGNRISISTASGTASYIYPVGSHRLIAVDGIVRNHDAAGNTVSVGGNELVYNDAGRLMQIMQAEMPTESYAYNHRGERVLRSLVSGGGQVTLYDEAGKWLANHGVAGNPLQQAIWLDDFPVAIVDFGIESSPDLSYIQPDQLGTPRAVLDPGRDVTIWEWSAKSEVFGYQAPNSDPDGDGTIFNLDLRFPGQQATISSDVFYNYQRDYDPSVGRYLQSDPIGLQGGISTYLYSEASPLDRADPLGLESGIFQFGKLRMAPPDGKFAADAIRAGQILAAHNSEMKAGNIQGADQFYHCLAACRATQATGDPSVVLDLMAGKEFKDYFAGRAGLYGKGKKFSHEEMLNDVAVDMSVNRFGASCDMKEDCARRCAHYVPERSRPYLQNYIPEWRVGE